MVSLIDLIPDTNCHQIAYQQILDHLVLLANPGTTSEIVSSAWRSPNVIDTPTVVTRGTGDQRKCPHGDINSPGLLVALIMGLSEHQSPGICIFLYLAPVLTVIQGRLMSHPPLYPLCRSYWPGIRSHEPLGIRAVSKNFSGENTRITEQGWEIGLGELWIR
jgi:hypothetical protein